MNTILVVDDTKEITDVLVKFIEREGHRVIFAYSGAEALEKCEGEKVDLVVTDFYMPMGGLEMIVELKEQQKEPFHTILISGSGITENPAFISSKPLFGIQETFTKPIDFGELTATINNLLRESNPLES